MGCCGRPANNVQKGGGEVAYHARYAYRSSSQLARLEEIGASRWATSAALTGGDPGSVWGIPT